MMGVKLPGLLVIYVQIMNVFLLGKAIAALVTHIFQFIIIINFKLSRFAQSDQIRQCHEVKGLEVYVFFIDKCFTIFC